MAQSICIIDDSDTLKDTLNKMFKDITDYFQKEITNVRKESFKKGQADVVYQKKDIDKREYLDDLD